MELWIRNQNKTTLAKIERISLYVDGGNINCNGEKFAHYETRKRALEVLDDIQRHIDLLYIDDKLFKKVYEMPEE